MPPPSTSAAANKQRQLVTLNAQLEKLQNLLYETEDLMRGTAEQADHYRALGGLHGALLMAAAKVLGDGGAGAGSGNEAAAVGNPRGTEASSSSSP